MSTTLIQIENSQGVIDTLHWEAQENFDEIKEYGSIRLIETKAVDIINLPLSDINKILLSAIAGAVWQRIIDLREFYNLPGDPEDLSFRVVYKEERLC